MQNANKKDVITFSNEIKNLNTEPSFKWLAGFKACSERAVAYYNIKF
jgi:hypothetical protein